jgi:hypothetical protein
LSTHKQLSFCFFCFVQSVVDEIVRKKRKEPMRKPADRPQRPKPALRPRLFDSDTPADLHGAAAGAAPGAAGWALGNSKKAALPTTGAGANLAFDVKGEENKETFGAITDNDL